MKNEDLVCKRLREIFNWPDHIPNEQVLKMTAGSYSLAKVKLKVNWNESVKQISVPFRDILKTLNGE